MEFIVFCPIIDMIYFTYGILKIALEEICKTNTTYESFTNGIVWDFVNSMHYVFIQYGS